MRACTVLTAQAEIHCFMCFGTVTLREAGEQNETPPLVGVMNTLGSEGVSHSHQDPLHDSTCHLLLPPIIEPSHAWRARRFSEFNEKPCLCFSEKRHRRAHCRHSTEKLFCLILRLPLLCFSVLCSYSSKGPRRFSLKNPDYYGLLSPPFQQLLRLSLGKIGPPVLATLVFL
jgi:hypothetical protein